MKNRTTPVRRGMKIVCVSAACGVFGAMTIGLGGCAAQRMSVRDATAQPVAGWEDQMPNTSRAGSYTFGGQPTEEALEHYAAEGGSVVIDLRTHQGKDAAEFDESATAAALGMDYLHLPMSSSTFSAADVDRFADALDNAAGPVLVHCGSSNRVGGMWAAYLAREQGWNTEKAIEAGKAAGMRSESVEEAVRRVIDEK
ncbi:MAG: sulfur transferase domain-containing protein [Planctomycetota bacterium]|nr:sulfur transferase domain-containing protein [Planctomycetota bacterium]